MKTFNHINDCWEAISECKTIDEVNDLIQRVMLVSRKFARQGKASAKPDGVVTYIEGDKSKL